MLQALIDVKGVEEKKEPVTLGGNTLTPPPGDSLVSFYRHLR